VWKYHPKHVGQFPDINKLCNVAPFWIYEYTGIPLGAHPILHFSRIRVKSEITAVTNEANDIQAQLCNYYTQCHVLLLSYVSEKVGENKNDTTVRKGKIYKTDN